MIEIECPRCKCPLQVPGGEVAREFKCFACGFLIDMIDRNLKGAETAISSQVRWHRSGDAADDQTDLMHDDDLALSDLEEIKQDEDLLDYLWRRCKLGAAVGLGIGILASLVTSLMRVEWEWWEVLFAPIWISALGSGHAFLIAALSRLVDKSWRGRIEFSFIVCLVIGMAMCASPDVAPVYWFLYSLVFLPIFLLVGGFFVLVIRFGSPES